MSARVTERTLYPFISKLFGRFGWRCFSETGVGAREPDLIIEGDGARVVSEVKIDSEIKLTEAIVDANVKARMLGTPNYVAFLFPRFVRDIPLSELERNFPRLRVSALILTDWLADRKELTLEDLAELFTTSFREWLQTKAVRVSYDLVVEAARESVREIAAYLRQHLVQKPVFDSAMAVIGRFDIYKSLLEDFSGISENEAKLYVADITSYILVNQLLFYHIISEKMGYERLPDVNPLNPPKNLLETLDRVFEGPRKLYPHILGFNLFPLLMETRDFRIVSSIARFISNLRALRPQYIREDLFGRLYHETIPPETRKNLGAFYTKPEAARLLASLAIDRWDAKVLDPACGSGTLLVEAYHRKMQLAPPSMSKAELHRKFLEEDIYGIDIMHFATHMSSMNLTAQNIEVGLKPHILSQDGIKTMIESAKEENMADDPPKTTEQPLTRWLEAMKEERIPKDFDVVIMNPPFTRRERIPAKKEDLERLVPEVKGKTGYWAYFVVAADKLLKENGTMAIVIPEEFFVGRAAESVRKYLFDKGYHFQYIIRTSAEVAFSESALYRDYLLILRKKLESPLILVVLKEKLAEIRNLVDDFIIQILDFADSEGKYLDTGKFEAIKVVYTEDFIKKHISNLKPLVGFNTMELNKIFSEFLTEIQDSPTLYDLIQEGLVKIRVYNPGQHKMKGVEAYSRKLFTSRYGARSPSTIFIIKKIRQNDVYLGLRKTKISFSLPRVSVIPSLRTYSKVKHIDITNEEEVAIIEPSKIPKEVLEKSALVPIKKAITAALDIKEAFNDLAGNLLLVRKVQLSSPELYWLSFFSSNKILGTTDLPNVQVSDETIGKILTLYFNSTLALIQLIAFIAETRGAWVRLGHSQTWYHVHVPPVHKLSSLRNQALKVFDKVSKVDVRPLFERVKSHDPIQREIDELALEMLGLNHWKPRLDEIYNAVAKELETMHKILETSRKKPKRTKIQQKEEKEKGRTESLTKWFKE